MADQDILKTNIISHLRLQNLPDEQKLELVDKMAQLVEKRILLRIMKSIAEKEAKEIEELSKYNEGDKLEFLNKKFPNMLEIMQEEIVKVKKMVITAGSAV